MFSFGTSFFRIKVSLKEYYTENILLVAITTLFTLLWRTPTVLESILSLCHQELIRGGGK